MTGAVIRCDLTVILGVLIFVKYDQRNRSSGCPSLEDTGEDFHPVRFAALCGVTALTGFAPIQEFLNVQ